MTQSERAAAFRLLHERPGAFVIPNPWDAGTARVLAGLGFEALATTSSGLAFTLGRRDAEGAVTRQQALSSAGAIAAATSLPVSADLENGFGDDPETVAETIRMAAAIGVVGGSIEDATTRSDDPVYPLSEAVERVAAAVEAARSLPFPFVLTAPRTTSTAVGISMTRSGGFRPTKPPAPTSCMRPDCVRSRMSGPSALRYPGRSTCWPDRASLSRSSPRRACAGSAWAEPCHGLR